MTALAPKPPVRVLILDATGTGNSALKQALQTDPGIKVVGVTDSSDLALTMAATVSPNVVVIVHRPASTDALLAIRHIMNVRPHPIVVVSPAASSVQGTLAFDLLEAGALAVVQEPWTLPATETEAGLAQLVHKIKLMSEVRVVRRWRQAGPSTSRELAAPSLAAGRAAGRAIEVVAIGASTGGPVVLKNILSRLPETFPLPILIVQHMSKGFVDGLARWLSLDSAIPVHIAVTGAALKRGHAYLAPDGCHMRISANGTLALDLEGPVNGHRPSVSCLLRSVVKSYDARAIGVLLTGMGQDGVAELKMMREAGAITIAQDKASSVVHGMPGEAIRRQAASHVMSPDEIAIALPTLAGK